MKKFCTPETCRALVIFGFLDLICMGLGMGIPIFCILLGFPVGWHIAERVARAESDPGRILGKTLFWAVLTSGFTFLGMLVLWGPWAVRLLEPASDLTRLGAPLILYEPLASYVAWLVLMIVVSPLLQLLMTVFGAHLALLRRWSGRHGSRPE